MTEQAATLALHGDRGLEGSYSHMSPCYQGLETFKKASLILVSGCFLIPKLRWFPPLSTRDPKFLTSSFQALFPCWRADQGCLQRQPGFLCRFLAGPAHVGQASREGREPVRLCVTLEGPEPPD